MATCVSCGTQNLEEAKFCLECGCSFIGATGQLVHNTVLEGRYIITRTLGRGGMGAVYLAMDQRLNNIPVAIKEMRTNSVGKGSLQIAIGAFKQEATMLISLRHPSLPRITDFFSQGEGRWYLVMDYIEGENLKAIAERRAPIPEAEAQAWAKQLCEILEYLHTQKPPIIFRDLKPANIMLTPQGQIKLIDFGIARHFRRGKTTDTTAYGSQGFAPPEQFGQNQTDARSDIYALGATLHYLLTGVDSDKNPFMFESPSKYVKISPEFEAAIMKTLQFKAQDRLGSAGDMLTILQTLGVAETPKATIPISKTAETLFETTILSHLHRTVPIKEPLANFDLKQINMEDCFQESNIYMKKDLMAKALYLLAGILVVVVVVLAFGSSAFSSKLLPGYRYNENKAAAKDEKGEIIGTMKNLKVEKPINAPQITWPENGAKLNKGNINTKWAKVPGAVEYKYAIRNLTADSVIIPSTKTLQPGFTINSALLTFGHQYKVWVAAVDDKGNIFDTTKVFTVKNFLPTLEKTGINSPEKAIVSRSKGFLSPLLGPALTPKDGSAFYQNDIPVLWNRVVGAVKYDISVKSLNTNAMVIPSRKIGETSFVIKASQLIPGNRYSIKVASIDVEGKLYPSYSTILIKPQIKIPAPELISPCAEETIFPQSITVAWKRIDQAYSYAYSVKDLSTKYQLISGTKTFSTSFSIKTTSLTQGHLYRIYVEARDGQGNKNCTYQNLRIKQ